MPPYNRYRGEPVRYSQRQTFLYKSQRIRWLKGLTYRPSSVVYEQDGVRLFRYRSYRATDGFWETKFDPAGHLPGEGGGGGTAPVCGLISPGSCLNDRLTYVKVNTASNGTYECVNQDGSHTTTISDNPLSNQIYVLAPGGGVQPPRDGTRLFGMSSRQEYTGAYPAGCVNGLIVPYSITTPADPPYAASTYAGWYFIRYDESADKVYRYVIWSYMVASGSTDFISDQLEICKTLSYSGSINAQFFFANDETINDHSYCLPGSPGTPPTPPTNTPLRYVCNCPDFTKRVEALPWSRYTSELSDRLIVGNTHSGDIGPCKHVYSAAVATGEQFLDPSTVGDPWTLQDYPLQTIVLDWLDPVPPVLNDDNNMEQLRIWREERRLRRRVSYTQSTVAFQQRQAIAAQKKLEFFQKIDANEGFDFGRLSDSDYNDYQAWRLQNHSNTHSQDPDDPGFYNAPR